MIDSIDDDMDEGKLPDWKIDEEEEHPGKRLKIKPDVKGEGRLLFHKEVEPMSDFEKQLCDFFVMKKMRERFGECSHNSEQYFPDPRIRRLIRHYTTK